MSTITYFITVLINEGSLSFAIDVPMPIKAESWGEFYTSLGPLVNRILTSRGQFPCDPSKITVVNISRL